MTDIVVGVRLNADGTGLVGQVKLSKAALQELRGAEKDAADGARDLSQATDQAAKSQARSAQSARQASGASADLTKNVGLQRAGWQQVGFQLQDISIQYSMGTRLSQIFAMQSGQLASAIAMIAQSAEGGKGKLAGLASFLAGGWGIAIGVAISVGTALASTLMDTAKAADLAKAGASGLADAQSVLGEIFDLTSGKIKAQNDLLIANARLMAINLRSEALTQRASAREVFASSDDMSWSQRARGYVSTILPSGIGSAVSGDYYGARENQETLNRLDAVRARIPTIKDDRKRQEVISRFMDRIAATDFSGLKVDRDTYLQAFINDLSATQKEAMATKIDESLNNGRLADELKRPDNSKPKKDNSAAKAAREAERLAQFSERAAEAVARLDDSYNTAPRDIDRARQSTAQLDAIIRDVNKRLDAGKNLTAGQRDELNRIKGDAERLKPVIEQSLVRPILDMLDGQQRQIDLGQLQLSGRQAEAEALQLTWSLMDKLGAESEEQLATELAKRGVTADQVRGLYANLEVMRQQTREMRAQEKVQQSWLSSVADMRENVRLTIQDLRKDGPKAVGDFFKRSMDVVDRLFSELVTEKLFGNFFRDLEDQITGKDKVSKAGDKLAAEVDKAAGEMKTASAQVAEFGKAVASATAMVNGKSAPANVSAGGAGGIAAGAIAGIASGIVAGDQPTYGNLPKYGDMGDVADIVVTARKGGGFKEGFEGVLGELKTGLKGLFTDIFGDKGIFSESLSKTLGRTFGQGMMGGAAGSLITGLLGIKGSGTGGMLGGAIGGALGDTFGKALGSFAGPVGSIIGGTLGSIVGGMLKKTPKASATITGGGEDDVSVTGNKSELRKASLGLAGSVQDALKQIADEFGGEVGRFGVSIGIRHGDYRVDTSGSGKTKIKKGAVDFNDDQAGAIAYAVMDAITDGGIVGISQAVQKALRSSSDLDKAIEEALKVREVETLLGGIGAQLEDEFRQFEKQAKERVRIANEYGFDVVAIEKKNAEDRAMLVDQILTDRIGSLQSLLDNMKYGDLFEGSLADQRQALLAQVAEAKTAAEAGEEGAADRLANLSRQLVELSRDAFGTAGAEYASDRDSVIGTAEAVIKAENERIKAAQDAATKQQEATQAVADNTATANDLMSKMLATLKAIQAASGSGSTSTGLDPSLVAR